MGIHRKSLRTRIILGLCMLLTTVSFITMFHYNKEQHLWKQSTNSSKISREQALYLELQIQKGYANKNLHQFNTTIRNIILTTWRSGSTFLGEAVSSHPGTFYHSEPLMHFRIVQVRSPGSLADGGTRVLKNLMNCDYYNLNEYVEFGRQHHYLHSNNPRLWNYCRTNKELCWDADFLSKMCKNFPIQLLKLVRFRLQVAQSLLQDSALDVRILLLIRDPRGVLQSRRSLQKWCSVSQPDCSDPSLICQDMVDDYAAAERFRKIYADKIMLVRYEDLTLNVEPWIRKILQFFRLDYDPEIADFLKIHTSTEMESLDTENAKNAYGTFRDTKSMPFAWIQDYLQQNATQEVKRIEENSQCSDALRLWGYANLDFSNISVLQSNFHPPLVEPPWSDMTIQSS